MLVFVVLAASVSLPQAMPAAAATGSTFTMSLDGSYRAGCSPGEKGLATVDVAVVEFADDGRMTNPRQLADALECIKGANTANRNGTVVSIFLHGFRHTAFWDHRTGRRDDHLNAFQGVVRRLAAREAERYGAGGRELGRRVVGIYIGWPGVATTIPGLDLARFRSRYEIAQKVGGSDDFLGAVADIVTAARAPGRQSVAIAVGHSLGALVLETAFSSLLRRATGTTGAPPAKECTEVSGANSLMPDLVVLLNTAAESEVTAALIGQVRGRVRKRVTCGAPYQAPLFVSLASEADWVTKGIFRVAKVGARTGGNDRELVTHKLMATGNWHQCRPRVGRDFGQSWHCLRKPDVAKEQLLKLDMDLPSSAKPTDPCHQRYTLERVKQDGDLPPFWVIQIPKEIVNGHSDIFNERSNLMIMALVQMGGALMSVWETYEETFEPEVGGCRPIEGP